MWRRWRSSSPVAHRLGDRRRLGPVAHVDLDLAASQAGGDLDRAQVHPARFDLAQALGDLRLGDAEHAHGVGEQRRRPGEDRLHRRRLDRPRPHRLQLARRPRQDDYRPLPGGDDQPRRGADRVEGQGALRHHRLLAVGLPHRLLVEGEAPREAAQDRRDLLLHLLVEHELAAGEAPDDLGGQVVGGRSEPARGDDQVHALGGEEAQRGFEIVRPVGDDEDLGHLDPALGQPFGDPRPVAIGDPPGDHLGSGHNDPRPDGPSLPGHSQEGLSPSSSATRLPLPSTA